MKMKYKRHLVRFFALFIGAFVGLFVGLLIIAQIFRVLISGILGWGDHGPEWANWMILVITILTMVVSTYFSVREANAYLRKSMINRNKENG